MEESIINTCIELVVPVMESGMVYAADYSKACGRSYVHSMDLQYGMRYAARTVPGRKVGSFFPEIYEDDSDSDESDSKQWKNLRTTLLHIQAKNNFSWI